MQYCGSEEKRNSYEDEREKNDNEDVSGKNKVS